MNYDVINIAIPEHLRIRITFRDGLTGEVRFSESHLTGVFESLKNPEIFNQARCDHGFVEWPGEIDLAPDAMHEEIGKNGCWVLS
jgi:hypothetical protein